MSTLKEMVSSFKDIANSAVKYMNMVDEFTNTSTKLSLINKGMQTQVELQDKVFAAANRSRGAYSDMASAVSDMGLMAGDQFKTNDELIAFTELAQKSFKGGGSSAEEQSSGMLQLTQSMGAGKLEGDGFDSIMKNAPMIADAIAKYTGKSKGELREMASQGLITSDIIKNAMFASGKEINDKFKDMPMTFADIWNRIKNGATQALAGVMERISNFVKSDTVTQVVNSISNAVGILAAVVSGALDLVMAVSACFVDNWSWIEPIIWGIFAALVVYNATMGFAWLTTLKSAAVLAWKTIVDWAETAAIIAMTAAQDGLNAALALCPITWIIIAVIALIAIFYAAVAAVNHFAGTSISATGIIMGGFATVGAFIYDLLLGIVELVLGVINGVAGYFTRFANFIGNIFTSPVSSIIYLFQGMADGILGTLEKIASAMDFVFGTKMAVTIAGWRTDLKGKADAAVAKYAPNENYQNVIDNLDLSVDDLGLKRIKYGDAYKSGYSLGEKVDNKASSLTDLFTGAGDIATAKNSTLGSDLGSASNPLSVKGTGANGAADVNMADEDLQYLRDIAERDYINKFSTATLAPNVTIQFGDVHEEADANKVAGRIKMILQEEIAIAAEGVYN